MLKQVSSFVAVTAIASSASAGAVYGFSSITNVDAEAAATGEAQFCVELIDAGQDTVEFYFINTGPDASSLIRLYWEDSLDLLTALTGWSAPAGFGVDFSGGNAGSLPGSDPAIDDYSIQVSSQGGVGSGVGAGEGVSVAFTRASSYEELLDALSKNQLQVGGYAEGFVGSNSGESFVAVEKATTATTAPAAAPSPTAALAGLGLLGLMAARRRRG